MTPFHIATVTELPVNATIIKGGTEDESKVRSFRLNLNGVTVDLCSLGASVVRLLLPNHDTENAESCDTNVVLGFENIHEMYETGNPMYFGITAGRVANRIGKGVFRTSPDGVEYQLEKNNGPNHLHGGSHGFSTRIWESEIIRSEGNADGCESVRFSHLSVDGDEGYPGTVRVSATYSLLSTPKTSATKLCLSLKAELLNDIPSPINLTQHSYFNLAGHCHSSGILDHKLRLFCDAYTPIDDTSIPTRHVQLLEEDSVMDWRCARSLRRAMTDFGTRLVGLSLEQVEADLSQRTSPLSNSNQPYGFDHNYVVRNTSSEDGLSLVAHLQYGYRRLTVRSTQPGVQLYTANYLDGSLPQTEANSNSAAGYYRWQGICLETQHFPDSICVERLVHPEFASGQCPILTPASPQYEHSVEYTFETEDNNVVEPLSTVGFHGTDSDGNHFYSIDDMWEAQGVTNNGNMASWYERAAIYYRDNCSLTVDGVLGGFASISEPDLNGSRQFLRDLEQVRPTIRLWTTAAIVPTEIHQQAARSWKSRRACECGAGLGRVTLGLLHELKGIDQIDLIDSSVELLAAAPDFLGNAISSRCRFFCSGLQEWIPTPDTYSVVWVQWVLSYLTDDDIVLFLRRCGESLVEDGVVILKENTCEESDFEVDNDDASVTRSLRYWHVIIHRAGLRIIHEAKYDSLLSDLYPVPMLALERVSI